MLCVASETLSAVRERALEFISLTRFEETCIRRSLRSSAITHAPRSRMLTCLYLSGCETSGGVNVCVG
ncbi:hypothetical protein E2C01_052593 [Portunus trituberculatus]|uniref:Uncharacterized protein n=1 Tax=Portunus trituberculatus TaxID=210409 RepID=A0A5B7GLX3_PORTR|nr:hypothetical protein [Portunus trituberculatus]